MGKWLSTLGKAAATLAIAASANAAQAGTYVNAGSNALLTTQGANVLSASGISVGGATYTAAFRDTLNTGSFATGTPGVFGTLGAFTTFSGAAAAAQALIDQVLINGWAKLAAPAPNTGPATLNLDTNQYANINGCSAGAATANAGCTIYIPYALSNSNLLSAFAVSFSGANNDSVSASRAVLTTINLTNDTAKTFAQFSYTGGTPLPSAVPEPSTWMLMMVGFGLAGAALRRSKAAERRLAVA